MYLTKESCKETVKQAQKPEAFTAGRKQVWKGGNKMRGQMELQDKNLDRICAMRYRSKEFYANDTQIRDHEKIANSSSVRQERRRNDKREDNDR